MNSFILRCCPNETNQACGLCGELCSAPPGHQLFLADNATPVCAACGRQHAPDLTALVHLASAAERIGRIERNSVFPPLTALLDLALSRYVREPAPGHDSIEHRAVRRMRDLIRERYAENLTLDEIASHAGLNKFYALRAFKRAVGVPPNTYQRHVRIARARELLRAGHDGAQLALDLGFCDQSHFDRWFRRIAHLTPTQYQRGR